MARPRKTAPAPKPATRTVALYTRVSTDQQGESGLSLESQRTRLDAYAAALGWEVIGRYSDVASASNLEREGLASALASGADAIVAVSLDRITRSLRDLSVLLDGPLRLVSMAESLDTGSPTGRLICTILGSIAQWEREATADRTKRALAAKKERGEKVGSWAYGWDKQGTPIPEEQAVIEHVRTQRARGLALQAICDGMPRPPRNGGKWYPKQIERILARP